MFLSVSSSQQSKTTPTRGSSPRAVIGRYGSVSYRDTDGESSISCSGSKPTQCSVSSRMYSVLLILLCSFIVFIENQLTTLLVGFFPVYAAREFQASSLQISALFSLYPMAIMVSSLGSSTACNYIGPQTVVCLGLFISGGTTLLFAYSTSMRVLLFYRFVQGLGAGAAVVGSISLLVDQFPSYMSHIIGLEELVVAGAFITAPEVGSLLFASEGGGYQMPFVVSAVAQLLAVPVTAILTTNYGLPSGKYLCSPLPVHICPASRSTDKQLSFALFTVPFGGILKVLNRTTCLCLLSTVAAMSCFGFIDPTLGSHLQHTLGIQHDLIGLGFGTSALVYFAVTVFNSWLSQKIHCRSLMLFGVVQLSIGFFLLGPPPFFSTYFTSAELTWKYQLVSLVFIGCGAAFSIAPALTLAVSTVVDENKRDDDSMQYMIGLFSSAVYLGQAIGPFIVYVLMKILPRTWNQHCIELNRPGYQACSSSLPWACTVYSFFLFTLWFTLVCFLRPSNTAKVQCARKMTLHGRFADYGQFVTLDSVDDDSLFDSSTTTEEEEDLFSDGQPLEISSPSTETTRLV